MKMNTGIVVIMCLFTCASAMAAPPKPPVGNAPGAPAPAAPTAASTAPAKLPPQAPAPALSPAEEELAEEAAEEEAATPKAAPAPALPAAESAGAPAESAAAPVVAPVVSPASQVPLVADVPKVEAPKVVPADSLAPGSTEVPKPVADTIKETIKDIASSIPATEPAPNTDSAPAAKGFERMKPPSAGDIYSSERSTPDQATSLSGDEPDIDASVRQRIEEDSKRVGKIAENLVGVQGDINRVEKEVLGKVFDMSTMKTFLNAHETAIKDHEKLDKEQADLSNQATSLSKQLDKAINETATQDKQHRKKMALLSSDVAEDKAVIQGLQKELVPLVEMQKEVEKLPPVNANITAQNTVAVAAAQAATEELVYEKSKLKSYQDTTKNLMKELVKQHDYATKCHERLYQLNTQLHEVSSKEQRMKYDQGRASAKGEAMEKFLEDKNVLIQKRLKKAKTNLQTITFAKANTKAKIGALQTEGQLQLEKLKAELGKLRGQSASIETAMMAKITNRKLIEKALRGAKVQVEDMQGRLLAGKLDKLQRNNTQMKSDLAQIRAGLQKAQISSAKAESKTMQLMQQAAQLKEQAANMTAETQDVAREALSRVVDARKSDDDASQAAQAATMEAQASQLVKCSAIWEKEHAHVNKKLKACKQVKLDLQSVKASVATLTSSVKMG